MRRRLFWTIAGVAAATGLLVLAAAVFASQRAAVDATYREMQVSSEEAVAIIDDFLDRDGNRPAAVIEFLRVLEGDTLAPLFGRIRRTAGGSEIGFARGRRRRHRAHQRRHLRSDRLDGGNDDCGPVGADHVVDTASWWWSPRHRWR